MPTAEEYFAALEAALAREMWRDGRSEVEIAERLLDYRADFEDSVRARVKQGASEPEATREVVQHRDHPDVVAAGLYRVSTVCMDLCMLNPWLFALVGSLVVVLWGACLRWGLAPGSLRDVLLFTYTGIFQSLLLMALSRRGRTWSAFLLPDEEGHRHAWAATQIIRLFLALTVFVVFWLLLVSVVASIGTGSLFTPGIIITPPEIEGEVLTVLQRLIRRVKRVDRYDFIVFATLTLYYLLGLLMPLLVAAAMAASGMGKLLIRLLGKVKLVLRHPIAD